MVALAKVLKMRSRAPFLLVLATTGAIFFLVAGLLWSDYREQLRKAESATRQLAVLVASLADMRIRQIDAALLTLSSEIPKTALVPSAAGHYQERIGNALSAHLASVVGVSGFHVCNTEGIVVYSSYGETGTTVNVAERNYFQQLRDDPFSQAVFSPVLKSRFSGAEVMVVARGFRDESGDFSGVVFGTLDIEELQRQLADADVEKRAVIVLKRTDNQAPVVLQRDESVGGGQGV